MISLHQDADGFIPMKRHFPLGADVEITFTDGSTSRYSGKQINGVFDEAVAEFRLQNHLDAKGFSRAPAKTVQPKSSISFVPVHPGMTT